MGLEDTDKTFMFPTANLKWQNNFNKQKLH